MVQGPRREFPGGRPPIRPVFDGSQIAAPPPIASQFLFRDLPVRVPFYGYKPPGVAKPPKGRHPELVAPRGMMGGAEKKSALRRQIVGPFCGRTDFTERLQKRSRFPRAG